MLRFLSFSTLILILSMGASWAQSHPSADDEIALIKKLLFKLQGPSFSQNVEYCGYIGLDKNGRLIASPATKGEEASCLAIDQGKISVITASYHTHAAYSPEYYGEIPSSDDVEGDEQMGIDGYVATPGGRLWYVDTTEMVVSQICSPTCLPQDRAYSKAGEGPIAQSYTYKELLRHLGE